MTVNSQTVGTQPAPVVSISTSSASTISNAIIVSPSNWLSQNPSFQTNGSSIDYPPNYSFIANYALNLINQDRATAGLSPVTLSVIASGQQHADSMTFFGYFSHWDVQGYKPYMRYTLLGGTGAVAENIGLDYCTSSPVSASSVTPTSCTTSTIENAIANSEWGMMNNHMLCCNNGHRKQHSDPTHNHVSIGIAYNASTSTLYFVEDFEDSYMNLSSPILSQGNQITIAGYLASQLQISQLVVYYDSLPQPMTANQLDATFAYDPGTFIGGVVPPCSNSCEYYPSGTTAQASVWNTNAQSIDIAFSLNQFITVQGAGVYTIYLDTGASTGTDRS